MGSQNPRAFAHGICLIAIANVTSGATHLSYTESVARWEILCLSGQCTGAAAGRRAGVRGWLEKLMEGPTVSDETHEAHPARRAPEKHDAIRICQGVVAFKRLL